MIVGVVQRSVGPGHDATGAAVAFTRGVDGVLPIVPAGLVGEDALTVLEGGVVFRVRVGAT